MFPQIRFQCLGHRWGGFGQAGAIRHGITRALIQYDETLRPALRGAGFVTRRPLCRKKEGGPKEGEKKTSILQTITKFIRQTFYAGKKGASYAVFHFSLSQCVRSFGFFLENDGRIV